MRPASPAAKAGLREGDQVLQVNGQTFAGPVALNRLLTQSTDQPAKLLVQRGAGQRTVTVKLLPFDELIRQKLGLTLLDPHTAEQTGVKPREGLYIAEVDKAGPAERGKLERGYVVTSIDGRATKSLLDIVEGIAAKNPGEQVHLTLVAPRRLSPAYVELRQGTVDLTLR